MTSDLPGILGLRKFCLDFGGNIFNVNYFPVHDGPAREDRDSSVEYRVSNSPYCAMIRNRRPQGGEPTASSASHRAGALAIVSTPAECPLASRR